MRPSQEFLKDMAILRRIAAELGLTVKKTRGRLDDRTSGESYERTA